MSPTCISMNHFGPNWFSSDRSCHEAKLNCSQKYDKLFRHISEMAISNMKELAEYIGQYDTTRNEIDLTIWVILKLY